MTELLWLIVAAVAIIFTAGPGLRWHDFVKTARDAEYDRLTAELPPERLQLTPEIQLVPIGGRRDWPARQTPTTLQAAYDGDTSVLPQQPLLALIPEPVVVQAEYVGRHRYGIAAGSCNQQHGPITEEFHAIVRHSYPDWDLAEAT